MKPSLSSKIVKKAHSAMVSAVEVYNRPSFAYREETFSILALNAWELLLKGKILADNGNKARSIWSYETRKRKDGKPGTKLYPQLNRTKNNKTISLFTAAKHIQNLDSEVLKNLDALAEVRDNSTHYFSAGKELAENVAAICVATVKNFVSLARRWFDLDLSHSFSLCLPLAFIGYDGIETVTTGGEKKLVKYLADLVASQTKAGDYAIALSLGVKFEKSSGPNTTKFVWSNDADAIKVTLTEAEFNARYPLTYKAFTSDCRKKIPSFLKNSRFNDICALLESNPTLSGVKKLDAQNPKSAKQRYYSSNMVGEVAKQWALPAAAAPAIVPST